MSWQEIAEQAAGLPPEEKAKLISWLGAALQQELDVQVLPRRVKPLRSLLGLCAHLGPGPTDEEIEEIRAEMWRNFPRDDII